MRSLQRLMPAIAVALSVSGPGLALAQADTTTTAQILAHTMSAAPSCASWRVSGTCFWLRCTLWSCSVRTSMRVSHYNPDAVVSTFHEDAAHPWADWGVALSRTLRSAAAGLTGMPVDSAGTRTRDDRHDRNKMFRDADVIGHPTSLLSLLGSSGDFTMLCPTQVRAFQPYLSSYTDALVWRAMLPIESLYPEALVPGLREIGAWPTNSWSALYPRDGNVTQQHPVKGAAVLSQRAGDITTRPGQPHLYVQLPTGGRRMVGNVMVWLPPPLVERDASTGKWQMLTPVAQRSCEAFGSNDSLLPASWGDGRSSGTGGYAFNLWRPYSCCSRAGQIFVGAVTF
jgi:integrating conjugative element protein (TIGR03756 family)